MAVARGCGSRVAGGLYIETVLSQRGRPIEHFLVDPVKPLHPSYRKAKIGTSIVQSVESGQTYVSDWVSGREYPNVADFVEEVRRFGLSRRIARNAPLTRLTEHSKILLIHGRGYVANNAAYQPLERPCPTNLDHAPTSPEKHCVSLWWDDVTDGVPVSPGEDYALDPRMVERTMPSFSYRARRRPDGVSPSYCPAIFGSFPISRLVVIRAKNGAHEPALRAAEKVAMFIPVVEEDE
jgi:hypothetical protein